ncbi:MAG: tetratricopeptide repeat protein [Bacteroidales bacterium]|nr:tetratricopeptide repeat protein [Bacteroidales bacterium]
MTKLIPILFILLSLQAYSQKEYRYLREGNRSFEKGDYSAAEKDYRKALEVNKESTNGQFNLGTAVYKEKNFEESANIFTGLSEKSSGKTEKAEVFHNLGNSLLEGQQYEKSIEAYKQALINNPRDLDSKYNLEYARMKLQQQQQQQQQNKDNKDKKEQDKKDQEDKQDQQQNQDKQDQQKQPPKPNKISKEDAERMLEAMKNDEKKTMEKVKKQKAKVGVVSVEKDW